MVKIFSKIIVLFSLFIFLPIIAHAATLSIIPPTGSFDIGEKLSVKVTVTSNNVSFNAISGMVVFPPSLFYIDSVSKIHSVLDFWVTEPVISKNSGTVKFEGVALGGFSGSVGTVITINLRAKQAGTGLASFESGQILANDGDGTDITGNLNGATFYVKEPSPKTTTPIVEPISSPAVSEPTLEVFQPAPTLKAPEIMLGEKYGAQAIVGTSDYPQAQALVTFVSEDGSKVFILGTAEGDGSFNILVPKSLKHGAYTVSAVMIKFDKTNSDTSNLIVVVVGNPLSDISWQVWLAIILLILTILYLLLRINSHFGEGGHNSDIKKHKLHDAQSVINKSFDLLREDIAHHSTNSELKKDINDAEKIIDKKIKDIES